MIIDVQLLGYLAKYSPVEKENFKLELDPDATVGLLCDKIKIAPEVEKMILVNGHQANPSTRLADGDEVFIFAPAAGG
ncbi:MAG: MoaD/ThiS family protein [Pseudomonadota bacterium]